MKNKLILTFVAGMSSFGWCTAAENDFVNFLRGIVRNPLQVGALTPCSRYVMREIMAPLAHKVKTFNKKRVLRVLEVGAGTGNCTKMIIDILEHARMTHELEYHFDVIEIDPEFCSVLDRKFGKNKHVSIFCSDACAWEPASEYDVIVSTVPFTNLKSEQVGQILDLYRDIICEDGVVTYIELIGFIPLNKVILQGEKKQEFLNKMRKLQDFKRDFVLKTTLVLRNVPPIYVHHLTCTSKKRY